MKDNKSDLFEEALKNKDIELMKKVPKAEFHNHSALGSNRSLLETIGVKIPKFEKINNIEEMRKFSKKYISSLTQEENGFKVLIENTIISALNDGIKILETSIDYRFFKFYKSNLEKGLDFLKDLKTKYKDKISLRFDIGLSRKNYNVELQNFIFKLIESNVFSGIDLHGDEQYNDLEKFKKIYEYGKEKKLKLKADVGEFGNENDIIKTIEYLNLDVVQHGISIINSTEAINYAIKKDIIFNICPTSNLLLNRIQNIKEHPIKIMYKAGLKVTINTDDLLLFNSTLSNEYLKLYNNNVLNIEELNDIRIKSLEY